MGTRAIIAQGERAPQAGEPKSWRDVLPVHPACAAGRRMSEPELRALGEGIKANGMRHPIELWEGARNDDSPLRGVQLIDGQNRLDALELVAGPVTVVMVDGTVHVHWEAAEGTECIECRVNFRDRNDPWEIAASLNLHRRHDTPEDRAKHRAKLREWVIAAAKSDPNKSINQIAKETGTTQPTASKIIKTAEAEGDVQRLSTSIDTLGRQQPATKPAKPPAPKPATAAPPPEPGASRDEWYTPSTILGPARKVLGHFHLDPASCDLAQEKVQARRYFTKADDGLAQVWTGSVWLNPPFSDIASWVSKLIAEYRAGLVTSSILLANNGTCSSWFHAAAAVASALCFPRGRIPFYGPDGETGEAGPRQGQVLFYFGQDASRFVKVFGEMGFVAIPAPATAAQLPEPIEPPIAAATEPATFKPEGLSLEILPPVILLPSDADVAARGTRDAPPVCALGKCRGYQVCATSGKCPAAPSQAVH